MACPNTVSTVAFNSKKIHGSGFNSKLREFTALVSTVNSENSRLVLRTRRKGGDTASAMAFTENSR